MATGKYGNPSKRHPIYSAEPHGANPTWAKRTSGSDAAPLLRKIALPELAFPFCNSGRICKSIP